MEETLHRQFKAICASVGLSEKDVLIRSFIFANTIATKRVVAVVHDVDGSVLDFSDVLHVTLNGTREARRVMRSIDSLATRLRKLEAFTHGMATSKPEEYPGLRREAVRLMKDGPWKDPKVREKETVH